MAPNFPMIPCKLQLKQNKNVYFHVYFVMVQQSNRHHSESQQASVNSVIQSLSHPTSGNFCNASLFNTGQCNRSPEAHPILWARWDLMEAGGKGDGWRVAWMQSVGTKREGGNKPEDVLGMHHHIPGTVQQMERMKTHAMHTAWVKLHVLF